MDKLKAYICSLIEASDSELEGFVKQCFIKQFKRKDWVQLANITPKNTYFINKGLVRFVITDKEGKEHNTHFSLEEQFSGDYASFLLEIPSLYAIQALEDVEIVVIPRKAVMWCYDHMKSGDRLGRLIAESFFERLPQGVDPCGENGEFHTFCYKGPVFKHPVAFTKGEIISRSYPDPKGGAPVPYWFCDILPT